MMVKKIVRNFSLTLLAATCAAAIGSVCSSLRVVNQLRDVGAGISDGRMFNMAGYDLIHFAPLYGLFILIAFTIAFLVAGGVFKLVKFARPVIYGVAGAVAIWVMLYLMQQVFFGVPIVAGARDNMGLLLQVLAGGIGGLLFAQTTRQKKAA